MRKTTHTLQQGVTLIETLLGVAVIAIVGFGVARTYITLLQIYSTTRVKIAASALAGEQMELIRNMPYSQVGTMGGIPPGAVTQLQTLTRDGFTFSLFATVRNIDDPFDGTIGGNPNDLSPADYKLVELVVTCTSCPGPEEATFTSRVAPKNLETASQNGALFVQAIDASGLFIQGATVQVINPNVNPAINITDVTNAQGMLQIVDVPPSAQLYEITVSKSGYSTSKTYALGVNFNPVQPHATVALQTVTQISFQIDRVGQIALSGVTNTCAPVGTIGVTMTGEKLIATNPDVPKYSQAHTIGASGNLTVSSLEWDTYALSFSSASQYLSGTIPNPPITLAPGGNQTVKAVMEPANPSALLVTVLDANTLLPLADAQVAISRIGFDASLTTGRGFLRQTDWSGGSGQTEMGAANSYASDDGSIESLLFPGEIRLKEVASSTFAVSGILESSTFNVGSPSSFYNLTFLPANQPPDTGADSVRFQLATATTSNPATWNFLGPDGTAGTYYTPVNTNIPAAHTGDQYLRYRALLSTASTTVTPSVADVAITFSSQCVPPGQVLFGGLTNANYTITITRVGYQVANDNAIVGTGWQEKTILMNP